MLRMPFNRHQDDEDAIFRWVAGIPVVDPEALGKMTSRFLPLPSTDPSYWNIYVYEWHKLRVNV